MAAARLTPAESEAALQRDTCCLTTSIDNPRTIAIRSNHSHRRILECWSTGASSTCLVSVRTQFCRGWVLALSAALCLLSGLKPACAAGCHVADRPILQSRFSWERDQSLDRTASFAAYAPPILTHPPCQGDVPHFSNPSSVTSPAFLPARTPVQRSGRRRLSRHIAASSPLSAACGST